MAGHLLQIGYVPPGLHPARLGFRVRFASPAPSPSELSDSGGQMEAPEKRPRRWSGDRGTACKPNESRALPQAGANVPDGAADAVHGSVYFKLLDDAAFFAVNSLIADYFALTASFTTYLLRPISEGIMKARGKVVFAGAKSYLAESTVSDSQGKEIARGSGNFVVSKIRLKSEMGYRV